MFDKYRNYLGEVKVNNGCFLNGVLLRYFRLDTKRSYTKSYRKLKIRSYFLVQLKTEFPLFTGCEIQGNFQDLYKQIQAIHYQVKLECFTHLFWADMVTAKDLALALRIF